MKLEVYKNPEFGSIRTALVNEQIYFVGKDVAESLGYSNTKDALLTMLIRKIRQYFKGRKTRPLLFQIEV